jgi:oligopeptide transport system permease protein
MSIFNRHKERAQENAREENSINLSKAAGDFEFVQLESSIYDQKFQTKPTTYFKDAVKRFFKSRAAVVGAVVLGVIAIMAVAVPLIDQNDIVNPQAVSRYLPPKWFDYNGGFLDGTKSVSDVVLNPDTMEPADQDTYLSRSIIGDIQVTKFYTTGLSTYGRGGAVSLYQDAANKTSGAYAPAITLTSSSDPSIVVTFDEAACTASYANNPKFKVALWADFKSAGTFSSVVDLTDEQSTYGTLNVTGVKAKIAANADYVAAGAPSSFVGRFMIYLDPVTSQSAYQRLYFTTFTLTGATGDSTDYSTASFSDATVMLQSSDVWRIYGSATLGVYNSVQLKGAFRYDPYDAAFGEASDVTVASSDIDKFIAKGWMTYTWGTHTIATKGTGTYLFDADPAALTLTEEGETYCPIRSVQKEQVTYVRGTLTGHSLVVTESLYRWDYYTGAIKKCEYPRYVFGTNKNGQDFFKIVFSGLLTSLALGLLTAAIDVVVGIIWGSISGYFGGWCDILMERFTEILGGVPWVVVMTIIILLMHSGFWTFLLALTLTGWIGVSSETRSQFYRYKGREYVLASRTLGASDSRLIFRHILPNGVGTIVTGSALIIPSVIFEEATISFLLPGLLDNNDGLVSFGVTLYNAEQEISLYPYMIVSASIVMILIMISFNLFGNGLRDAFNPSLKGSNE